MFDNYKVFKISLNNIALNPVESLIIMFFSMLGVDHG